MVSKMPATPRQTFRMEEILWRKFKAKCKKEGYTASEVLRAFVEKVLSGKISIKGLKPTKTRRGVRLSQYEDMFRKWLEPQQ